MLYQANKNVHAKHLMFQAYLKGNGSICARDAHNVDDVGTLSH